MTPRASSMTAPEFTAILTRYDATVTAISKQKPPTLADLDAWRRTVLPGLICSRDPPHITLPELHRLMECKLKRGKSRPLLHLIDSNPPASVVSATTEAFSILGKAVTVEEGLAPAIKAASKLKGVGPATATYVLAAFKPRDVPVFSDDGYRWVMWEEGKGKGWDRGIKYTEKEYVGYFQGIGVVKERLKVNVEDVERCGFVLGKEAEGITAKVRGRQKLDAGIGGDLKTRRKAVGPPKVNNGSAMPGNRQNKKLKAARSRRQVPAHKSEMTTRPVRMLRSRKSAVEEKE